MVNLLQLNRPIGQNYSHGATQVYSKSGTKFASLGTHRYVQTTCASAFSRAPNFAFRKCGRFQEPEPQQKTVRSPGLELLAQRRHIKETCASARCSLDS